ncbi:DNA-binding PucR family transcriptional regulator [Scopulibacillus darangshiensis]|uniref:DNA-binding PucR family transcriptional regulator n=1 Tax=Scopulibacillus darangshiensis TaxID=442528 RepID=A0A4R2P7P7_9BACL|nr:DNA-binding PucR family transcriptional regulator [Scopulibacillus darangshiensis]
MKDPFKYGFDRAEDMAERISEVLECPITIEDVNHRLLAYSTHDNCTDPARISTIIGRRVPGKVINNLWKDGTIPKLLASDEPVRVKSIDEVGLGDRVAISIWRNNEVLGFIWALEINKKLSDQDLELLKKAAQAVKSKLLKMHVHESEKVERNQEFFWKILTDNFSSSHEMKEGFQKRHLTPPSQYAIAILKFNDEIADAAEKQLLYLLNTSHHVQIVLSTIDYDQFIMLIEPKGDRPLYDAKTFMGWLLAQLSERFNIHSARSGVGGLYTNLLDIEKSYRQALSVLLIKKRFPQETNQLDTISELGLYQYLDIYREQRKKDGFVNYSLRKLKEYDQKHHTNLTESLKVFLEKDSNVNTAAKALNVHINTLSYRLKRMADIAEIDLHNAKQKMTIYLDLKIDEMNL